MQLLRPSLLAVGLPNGMQDGIVKEARMRLQHVRDKDHVKQIADGYHRVCMGVSLCSMLFAEQAWADMSF
jgi:hypothetical protein